MTGFPATPRPDPRRVFHSEAQLRLNSRRLEHLSACGLAPCSVTVLEVGAGIGDLTPFLRQRRCTVVVTEGRPELVAFIGSGQSCLVDKRAQVLDLDQPPPIPATKTGAVFCYGVLHLLARPAGAIGFMASCLGHGGLLLLETVVSTGVGEALNPREERTDLIDGSIGGSGCRPTRAWVWGQLRERFGHVYVPRIQPSHEAYPTEWLGGAEGGEARAVFVASHAPITNAVLADTLLERQQKEGSST